MMMTSQTVLLRTTLTRTTILYRLTDKLLGKPTECLRVSVSWTSVPSAGSSNTSSCFMQGTPQQSDAPTVWRPCGLHASLPYLIFTVTCFVFLSGYQRELSYKRTDGSYSAFGNGDSEGNMWYVGFVSVLSSEYIKIMIMIYNSYSEFESGQQAIYLKHVPSP